MHMLAGAALALLLMSSAALAATDSTVISMGSAMGVGLEVLVAAVATPLAAVVGLWLQRVARRIGVEIADADRARLDAIVENGVIWAAARANVAFDGQWPLDVHNGIVADAANYAVSYGRDTLKRLKAPIDDPAAMQDIILPRVAKLAERAALAGLIRAEAK